MKPIKAAIVSVEGKKLKDEEKSLIEKENPLGIALFVRNIENPQQLKQLVRDIKTSAGRDDILIAIDQEGGRVCRLSAPYWRAYAAQAAIGALPIEQAKEASRLHADLIAHDLQTLGINCDFAPVLDVATPNITSSIKSRCFSLDEKTTAVLGKVVFETLQKNGILSCIKHLPGHSGALVDPHLHLPIIEHPDTKYFHPFQELSPKALMAMTAHIVLPEIDSKPITMSNKAVKSLIRGDFGFKGILISDALEMKALPGSLKEKTKATRKAGCDAVCYCRGDMDGLHEVLDNCGYLSDKNMEVWQSISSLIQAPHRSRNLAAKNASYDDLMAQMPVIKEDYDAVEVLNKLYNKK